MTTYLTQEDMAAARFAALLAEDRANAADRCCAACRRGTRELGQFPCGAHGRCECHRKETR